MKYKSPNVPLQDGSESVWGWAWMDMRSAGTGGDGSESVWGHVGMGLKSQPGAHHYG